VVPASCDVVTIWATRDPKLFECLTRLIVEPLRDPFGGIGGLAESDFFV
jgi:hypothetical protein